MKLPPYTIPDQDRDLWEAGAVYHEDGLILSGKFQCCTRFGCREVFPVAERKTMRRKWCPLCCERQRRAVQKGRQFSEDVRKWAKGMVTAERKEDDDRPADAHRAYRDGWDPDKESFQEWLSRLDR